MTTMILSHPRSMSTVFGYHFPDFRNEIFEQASLIHRPFFKGNEVLYHRDNGAFRAAYLEDFKKSMTPETTFKAHYHQLLKWEGALEFVESLNPRVIAIERLDKFAALTSFFLGLRRGFFKTLERPIRPFVVSRSEFDGCRAIIVDRYQEGLKHFKPGIVVHGEYWEKSVEILNLKPPVNMPIHQHSKLSEHLIQNLDEVRSWWDQS